MPPVDNPNGGVNVLTAASNVTIDGFSIDGHNASRGGGVVLNGVAVNSKSGIANVDSFGQQYDVNHLAVQNDVIRNFTLFGMIGDEDTYNGKTPLISTGNVIRDNLIDNMPTVGTSALGSPDQARGISIEDNFYARVTGNVITRTATGIQTIFDLAVDPTGLTSMISGNEVHAYHRGILVYTADTDNHVFDISANKVLAEQGAGTTATAVGIDIERVLSATSVTLSNHDVSGFHVGVEVGYSPTTAGVTVAGGTLSGNVIGVLLSNAGAFKNSAPLAVRAALNGVTVLNSKTSGVQVADTLRQTGATVTLSIDAASTIAGSPRGAVLSGIYAKLSETSAPTVAFTGTPPATSTSSTASFAYSASDNVSTPNDIMARFKLDSGSWTSTTGPINLSGLANGSHAITVEVTDQAGNKGTVSYRWSVQLSTSILTPTVPILIASSDTGVSSTDGVTRDSTPSITGTATPGLSVSILAGTTLLGKVKADTSGKWKFTVGGAGNTGIRTLADGVCAITAIASDASGNTSPASLRWRSRSTALRRPSRSRPRCSRRGSSARHRSRSSSAAR